MKKQYPSPQGWLRIALGESNLSGHALGMQRPSLESKPSEGRDVVSLHPLGYDTDGHTWEARSKASVNYLNASVNE